MSLEVLHVVDNKEGIRMKPRKELRSSELSLRNNSEISTYNTSESCPVVRESGGKCKMQDAGVKLGTLVFGLLFVAGGVAGLFYGFKPYWEFPREKGVRHNKILLLCGFFFFFFGTTLFVASILLFKNIPCGYPPNERDKYEIV